MSGHDYNRKRNQRIGFWMTPAEKKELLACIAVAGIPKGQYMIESVLHQRVEIITGKYQSDRLSLEVKRLRERLGEVDISEDLADTLEDCRALMEQFIKIIEGEMNLKCGEGDTK